MRSANQVALFRSFDSRKESNERFLLAGLCGEVSVTSNLNVSKNLRLEIMNMKKWQETRNYRRIKDQNGIIINIITVDGVDVEVNDEVFLAYSQADRRERYITEEVEAGKLLSLEQLLERGVPFETLGIELEESAEVSVLEQADRDLAVEQTKRLMIALSGLERDEQELIQALFFDSVPVRAYSRQLGVRLNTVQYRRDKLLKKLREKIFS